MLNLAKSELTHLHVGWLEDEYIFSKFGRTIPLNETSGYNTSFSVALRSQY